VAGNAIEGLSRKEACKQKHYTRYDGRMHDAPQEKALGKSGHIDALDKAL
jgi:hypothetical protein